MTEQPNRPITLARASDRQVRSEDVIGHIGTLEYLTARELLVDKDYQRIVNNRRVDLIVEHYDQDVFGVLYANRRERQSIYIMDGQHRWEAVRKMHAEDRLIPTFIVDGLTKEEEAAVFWKMNQFRLHPGSLDTFRARIQAGEPGAVAIQQIAWDTGVHLMQYPAEMGPTDIMAYKTLERIYELGLLPEIINLIREGWPFERGAFRAAFMMGVTRFVQSFRGLYDHDHLRGVMAVHGPRAVESRALFYKTTLSSSPQIAFARALHYFYNEHASGGAKLPQWGDFDSFVAPGARPAPEATGD